MKILGLTYYDRTYHFTMKCDSSLLNQGKPFFLPEWSEDMRQNPCYVARINRLGKYIAPKFASRYYDAIVFGTDFVAMDLVARDFARATAFDNALAVGNLNIATSDKRQPERAEAMMNKAISEVSRVVTLRMGDLVYIDFPQEPEIVVREQVIERDGLFCRIK